MGITQRISDTTKLSYFTGKIPIHYKYTMGMAGEKFFRALMEKGQILGTHCAACDFTYVPAQMYCERCFARLEEYIEVPPTGEVYAATQSFQNRDGSAKEQPTLLAMIRLDGTDGGLVHYLGEVDPEEVFIGMPVQAVFQPKAKRKGNLFDIKYFKPIG
jgi:uncharacterized OB-fold protein